MASESAELTTEIAEATARILADLADPQAVNAAPDDVWSAPLWAALEDAGLTRAWVSEPLGGAGAGLDAGFAILRVAGQYACPVALAETLLAGRMLADAGRAVPEGMLTLAPVRRGDALTLGADGRLAGRARGVPYASQASRIVALVSGDVPGLVTVDPAACQVSMRQTDMGDARADVVFDGAEALSADPCPGGWERLEALGATARACQMAGALETALKITVDYTGERTAFGRKIAKFQAVQQNLAELAGEVAAALTASGSAADTLAQETDAASVFLEVASAKIRVGEAAEAGVALAHQAHGAIGWTQDYVLQRFTRRLMGWRDDFGSEADWAVRLGARVAAQGADELWPWLTTR